MEDQSTRCRILRLPEVMAISGLARSTIYLYQRDGRFPRSIPLGGRARGWVDTDVHDWIEEQRAAGAH